MSWRTALCDDEAGAAGKTGAIGLRHLEIRRDCFSNGETLLAAGQYGIAFLDICTAGMTGPAAGCLPDCQAVFTTTGPSMRFTTMGLNVSGCCIVSQALAHFRASAFLHV